jgi:hypothetical protein
MQLCAQACHGCQGYIMGHDCHVVYEDDHQGAPAIGTTTVYLLDPIRATMMRIPMRRAVSG